MTSGFLATIVIPLLDQVDSWLEQCVRSALDQTVQCEVVVVLSPKTRPSNLELLAALAKASRQLRVLPRDVLGFPGALNAGFAAASANRVGLVLSDDWLDPRAVELCVSHDADIVSSGNRVWNSQGTVVFEEVSRTPHIENFLSRKTLERKASYLQHFFLFRKSKLEEIGGADESLGDFPGIDDFDMVWVLLEQGATVAVVEQQLYNYRDHEGDRLSLRPSEQAVAVLQKILAKHGVAESERAKIIRGHSLWYGRQLHVVFNELRKNQPSS